MVYHFMRVLLQIVKFTDRGSVEYKFISVSFDHPLVKIGKMGGKLTVNIIPFS